MGSLTTNGHTPGIRKINYSNVVKKGKDLHLNERIRDFHNSLKNQKNGENHLYFRTIASSTDRVVNVMSRNGTKQEMLMFGSNNYLGLANHPHIIKKVKKAIKHFGVGIAGPPILNGYSKPMVELEYRLSSLKGTEDTMIYSSGYNANLGLVSGVCKQNDLIIADEYNHASFFDGVRLMKGRCLKFRHNDTDELEKLLKNKKSDGDTFIVVEGVYSMDGDLAPLHKIIPLAKKHKAQLMIDDAHGTGVCGSSGQGTLEEFGYSWDNEIILGTFSKTFAVNGGFVSGSKELVGYLRFMARSYMFSASLPPVTIAAVHAGLDILEKEPWRRIQLKNNVQYLAEKLEKFGITTKPAAGIIALEVPKYANIRKMANQYHDSGIFLNAIEFPAVPLTKQRFRISVSTNHTKKDLDKLVEVTGSIWKNNSITF